MKLSNCDLGVASEGSLVLTLYLLCRWWVLIFIDTKNNLEIIVRELSMETNFNGSEITNEQELLDFAELVHPFPRINPSIKKQKKM
jgi:hypothetical protein